MRKPLRIHKPWLVALAITIIALGTVISVLVFATGDSRLTITAYADVIRFHADGVATLQVRIFDLSGKEVWDSGVVSGGIVDWDRNNDFGERLAYGAYIYSAQGWNALGDSIFQENGKLALMPGDKVQLQAAPGVKRPTEPSPQAPTAEEETRYAPMTYSHTGDFTVSGNLGVGTETPQGSLHIARNAGDVGIIFENTSAAGTKWVFDSIGTGSGAGTLGSMGIGIYGSPMSVIVTADGKVGIGTANPNATLDVHGSATNLLALYDPIAPSDPKFRVEKDGDVYADGTYYCADGAFHVGSADVAERINTSEWVEPGNVVEIDPEHPGFFRKSSSPYSTKVAGIISTSPGVVLGNSFDKATDDWEDNRPVLAVTGRVPCKVSAENGPIQIGDLLVASSTPGIAMKGDPEESMGAVVGKAMEPLAEDEGTIVVQVMLR